MICLRKSGVSAESSKKSKFTNCKEKEKTGTSLSGQKNSVR